MRCRYILTIARTPPRLGHAVTHKVHHLPKSGTKSPSVFRDFSPPSAHLAARTVANAKRAPQSPRDAGRRAPVDLDLVPQRKATLRHVTELTTPFWNCTYYRLGNGLRSFFFGALACPSSCIYGQREITLRGVATGSRTYGAFQI